MHSSRRMGRRIFDDGHEISMDAPRQNGWDYGSCPGSHAVGPRRASRQRLTKPRFRRPLTKPRYFASMTDETGNARPGGLRPKPNGNGQTAHRNQEVFKLIKSIYTNNDSDNHNLS